MGSAYSMSFLAGPEQIDENGHVNNTIWVRWMEELAGAHWLADAAPEHIEAYGWIVTRHEIDYRGNIGLGERATGTTEIRDPPRGSRFVRHITFTDASGRELVRAATTWAMVERATGKLARVPPALAARFLKAP